MTTSFLRPLALASLGLLLAACSAAPSPMPSSSTAPSDRPTTSPSRSPIPPLGASPSPVASPSESPTGSPAANDLPADPNTLVLAMRQEGGFIAPSASFAGPAGISVYADGRVITPGAQTMIYPGALLAPLTLGHLSLDQVRAGLAAAAAAGLSGGGDQSYPARGVADMPNTVFVVWSPAGPTTTSFGALESGVAAPDPTEAQARTAALAFSTILSALTTLLNTETYQPSAVRLLVSPAAPTDPSLPAGRPLAWPLAAPLGSFGTPYPAGSAGARCGAVSGPELATLWPLLKGANQLTTWTSGGKLYQLVVRQLLPDESGGCPSA